MPHIPSDNVFGVPECDFYGGIAACYMRIIQESPIVYQYKVQDIHNGTAGAQIFATANGDTFVIAASEPNLVMSFTVWKWNSFIEDYQLIDDTQTFQLNTPFTYNDLTVYYYTTTQFYADGGFLNITLIEPNSTGILSVTSNRPQYAWLMVYGGYTDGYLVTYVLDNCTGSEDNPSTISPDTAISNFDFTPNDGYKFIATSVSIEGEDAGGNPITFVWDHETGHLRIASVGSDVTITVKATSEKDPYDQGGETTAPGGGEGDFDNTSEPVPVPDLPTLNVSHTGFISLFNPSLSDLQSLATYLWSDTGLDLDTFKRIFTDPISTILGLTIVPVIPESTISTVVKLGNVSTGVTMPRINTQYVKYDCGTIRVNEYWGGYLDYSPYTSAEIYLPYIGTKPLNIDDIMGKSVHVVYNIDVLSGACCAMIDCDGSVLYQFVGQCACSVPVTGRDMTNLINGILSVVGAGAGTFVKSGGNVLASGASAIGALAANVTKSKPSVEKSGSMGSMGGMLGVRSPYLILTRPKQALPSAQNRYTGYPSYITSVIGNLTGYTVMSSVHLVDMPATNAEKDEIEQLLLSGVIL